MTAFLDLVREMHSREVRFVLIGVWGANYFARSSMLVFSTRDHDLFLPRDPDNLVRAWQACEALALQLSCGREPLDTPHDVWLAKRIVEQRALIRASDESTLDVDLTFVMGDFDFERVWKDRRTFVDHGIHVPVARLSQIVESKATVGRPKDKLFLVTHQEELRLLLDDESS